MYNNGSNGQNRRNNNQRRGGSRNGSSGKSNNRGGQPRVRNYDDENITPQQKRHFVNKRDTHLSRGKELRAAGDRVEAENEFQHAEHYTRMIKIADDQQQKFLDRKAAERPQHGEEGAADVVDSVESSEAPTENSNVETAPSERRPQRNQRRNNRPEKATKDDVASVDAAQSPTPETIAELPFMQPIPTASE